MAFYRTIAKLADDRTLGTEGMPPVAAFACAPASHVSVPSGLQSLGHDIRLTLHLNGEIADGSAMACSIPVCPCQKLRDHLPEQVHVQDRPAFLKSISDALYENRPVQAIVRLVDRDMARQVRMQFWPAAEAGTVNAIVEPVDKQIKPEAADEAAAEAKLYPLMRSELLELSSSLSILLKTIASGSVTEAETLDHLQQRLDDIAQLLSVPADNVVLGAPRRNLLRLLQDTLGIMGEKAGKRQVTLGLDLASAVRKPISISLMPLLRLLIASAVDGVAEGGTIKVATRQEGQIVAITLKLSAGREMEGDFEKALLDRALLRNLAIRHGGRFSIVHGAVSSRQWVLRLPLMEQANNSLTITGLADGGAKEAPAQQPANHYSFKMG